MSASSPPPDALHRSRELLGETVWRTMPGDGHTAALTAPLGAGPPRPAACRARAPPQHRQGCTGQLDAGCRARGVNVPECCEAGNTPTAAPTALGTGPRGREIPPLTAALRHALQDLLFLLQLLLLGRLLPSCGESQGKSKEVSPPPESRPAARQPPPYLPPSP